MSALLPICPILMTTDEGKGDLVFDPFSGTNVVGYISQLLNRRTLTTEVSPTYFNEGCKNLQKGVNDFNTEGLKLVNDIAFRDNDQELETAA
jgi:DNA modification methylase